MNNVLYVGKVQSISNGLIFPIKCVTFNFVQGISIEMKEQRQLPIAAEFNSHDRGLKHTFLQTKIKIWIYFLHESNSETKELAIWYTYL